MKTNKLRLKVKMASLKGKLLLVAVLQLLMHQSEARLSARNGRTFELSREHQTFLLDGQPFRLIDGKFTLHAIIFSGCGGGLEVINTPFTLMT